MRYNTESHKQADKILADLTALTAEMGEIQSDSEKELEAIKAAYKDRIAPVKEGVEALEKALKTLAKKHRADLFDGRDRIDLENGALIFSIERRVKKAKCVLQKLKELEFIEAIKIAESVDWDQLEKWTDERLFLIGTERKVEEKFEYELIAAPLAGHGGKL
ncbi:MAG TPA: host-nuclease inhibitor Gam family protein [Desulfatiglandales bacterium]|nr:host-nuclease inhibitor Gam family protein [Desulfatiglandales bacterium]